METTLFIIVYKYYDTSSEEDKYIYTTVSISSEDYLKNPTNCFYIINLYKSNEKFNTDCLDFLNYCKHITTFNINKSNKIKIKEYWKYILLGESNMIGCNHNLPEAKI